jgi:hypothetical protein
MVEEAAHASAPASAGVPAVEPERVAAVMLVAMTVPAAAMVMMMSSKHEFRLHFVISEL